MSREISPLTKALCLSLFWISCCTWASEISSNLPPSELQNLDFAVFWPPKDPSEPLAPGARPLLNGCVNLRTEQLPHGNLATRLRIMLSRPSDEPGRDFWNSLLAFPEYDWMRYVRVWDVDQRWLWPNLSYLLRLHGTERVERYGGVDPGKGVDNDFAAVLIREFDASGQNESEETKRAPLVAAEWYPVGAAVADKQRIVHKAQSEEFTLHLGGTPERSQGLAAVWLIYADFMEAKPPAAWPQAPEFAGGILAYFEIKWDLKASPGHEINVRQLVPKRSTGFDWERWTLKTRAAKHPKSTAKLADLAREGVEL
jgi:hypothetical protein